VNRKYWCTLGGIRTQVTLENCRQCDINAGLEVGTYEYCEVRHPYKMQITEAFHELKWWLKLLWEDPVEFPYYFASELFKKLGQKWGWSVHIMNGKVVERKLWIGIRRWQDEF